MGPTRFPPQEWSLANRISLFRLLIAPIVLVGLWAYSPEREWVRLALLWVYAIAMLSDGFDGWVARLRSEQTRFGAVLDPLADKVLILCALIGFYLAVGFQDLAAVPSWFLLTIAIRECLVLVVASACYAFYGYLAVRPSLLGKAATALLMIVIFMMLLGIPVSIWILYLITVLSYSSLVHYLWLGVTLLQRA